MNLPVAIQSKLTMSSVEISEFTGKEHKHVLRDIRAMLAEIESDQNWADYKDSMGRAQPMLVLDKEQTLCLITGYSAKARMAIIKRWQELEGQQKPAIPQTYAAALLEAGRLAMELEQSQQQLALAAPKVEFVDRYVTATGNLGFRQVAKLLNANERQLKEFLFKHKIMYRLAGELTPHQNHIDAGRFEVKTGVADHGDSSHAFTQAKFTPKGVEWLAGELAKAQIAKQIEER